MYKRQFEERRDFDLNDAIAEAVDELWRGGGSPGAAAGGAGDILVFLPGEREIREASDHLRKHLAQAQAQRGGPPVEILPLFARLSQAEQDRVFEAGNGRRIVLATNVAETSLTVPGIRYVIDTGLARVKRYSYRSKVEQLQVEAISQAAANQRAGRCGRVADGVCIRLYAETEFAGRPRFTDPEILRSSLAGVILRMKSLRLGTVEDFQMCIRDRRRAARPPAAHVPPPDGPLPACRPSAAGQIHRHPGGPRSPPIRRGGARRCASGWPAPEAGDPPPHGRSGR